MSIQQEVRRTLATGFALALLLTVFLGAAVMVVPIYDMQLYDRVMQSRSMDTLALLSLFCVVGLGLYGLLEYLRSACFIAIAETVGQRLHGAVLDEGARRAAAGNMRAGPELVRDLNTLQGFLSSGAVAVPLDALCAPLFLAVLFMLHPAFRPPRQSGWGFDPGRKLTYRRVDSYLTPRGVPMKAYAEVTTRSSGTTWSFHRPLSVYVNTLNGLGFRLERLDELPDPNVDENTKKETLEIPLFAALRAKRAP